MSERAREPLFFEDAEEEAEPEPSTQSAGRGGSLTAVGSGLGDDEGEPPGEGWTARYDDPGREDPSLEGRLGSAIKLLFHVHSLPIEELNLSMQSAGVLRRNGLITLGQIMSKTEGELLALRNFSRKRYGELRERLDKLGLGPVDAPWDSIRGVN